MIQFVGVSKVFPGGTRALDEVTFTIAEGECVVFVGPSGCGKTTTLKLANRLAEPTSGKILVGGRDIMTCDPISLRRGIGYVIQEIGLFPHMTVLENAGLVPRLLRWPADRVTGRAREMLALVDLPPPQFERKYPHQLSGGQRQRVGVARALAADPPVILMDEPFGALDPITRAQLQEQFLQLRARVRKTILFVTHDIDEAMRLGDRVAIMRAGRIVQMESPAGVLRHPADDFVCDLVGRDRAMKLLKLARVRDLTGDGVARASVDCAAGEALRLMAASGSDTLLVVGRDGAFEGVLGYQDLEGRAGPVGSLGPSPHPSIAEGQRLHDAMEQMISQGRPWLAVVNDDRRLVGVITMSAFARLLVADKQAGQGGLVR